MRYGFGVDIYGSNTKIGFFDETGKLLDKWKMVTPMLNEGSLILPAVAEEINGYIRRARLSRRDIIGIGVGVPGPVNAQGVVNRCVNFGWGVFNIDQVLSSLTDLPVKSGNIANLSAVGEHWQGGGSDDMIFVALNTGLGGGVVCGGNVVYGANGGGGEFGHMVINRQETDQCSCGRRGCAEQYCSPTGILRVARRHLLATKTPSTLRLRPIFDYREVLDAAECGDKVGREIMSQVYDYAAQCLANACSVTNPDTIILGGEFCRVGTAAVEGIARHFNRYIFHANKKVRFDLAVLGTDACIYGAFKHLLDHQSKEKT